MTPSVSVNVSSSGKYTVHEDTFPSFELTKSNVTLVRESRPQSTSVPFVNGFRRAASFHHYGLTLRFPRDSFVDTRGSHNVAYEGFLSGYSSIPDVAPSEALTVPESVVDALNKIRDQKVNASVFLAELGKSATMVNRALIGIARDVIAFRKGNPRLWRKVKETEGRLPRDRWCEIPSMWLQLQYGWKPLMTDIVGIIDEASRKGEPSFYAVGKSSRKFSTEHTIDTVAPTSGTTQSASFFVDWKQSTKTELFYALDRRLLVNAARLGLISPDEVVWELLPYSFVVDWALPIGPWLSAIHADAGLRFLTGSSGTLKRGQSRMGRELRYHGGAKSHRVPVDLPRCSGFKRTAYASSPVPWFYVKNPLSAGHIANGLSLLAEAFRR